MAACQINTTAHALFLLGIEDNSPEPQGCIYLLCNLKNGKGYVGKAIDAEKRWATHISLVARGSKQVIHRAIRKHGVENFSAEILRTCKVNDLNDAEAAYIKSLKTHISEGGYNLTYGGDGGLMDVSVRKRMSAAAKARMQRPGERERISAEQKLRWQDPVYAANFSAAVAGRVASRATRLKMSRAQKARYSDPACLAAKSLQSKKALATPEARKAHSERLRAVLATPEARQLKSSAAKKFWRERPELHAQASVRSKTMWKNPAHRAKVAAGHARRRAEREASLA